MICPILIARSIFVTSIKDTITSMEAQLSDIDGLLCAYNKAEK